MNDRTGLYDTPLSDLGAWQNRHPRANPDEITDFNVLVNKPSPIRQKIGPIIMIGGQNQDFTPSPNMTSNCTPSVTLNLQVINPDIITNGRPPRHAAETDAKQVITDSLGSQANRNREYQITEIAANNSPQTTRQG